METVPAREGWWSAAWRYGNMVVGAGPRGRVAFCELGVFVVGA